MCDSLPPLDLHLLGGPTQAPARRRSSLALAALLVSLLLGGVAHGSDGDPQRHIEQEARFQVLHVLGPEMDAFALNLALSSGDAHRATLHRLAGHIDELLDHARLAGEDRDVSDVACRAVLFYDSVLPRNVRRLHRVDAEFLQLFRGRCDRCLVLHGHEVSLRDLKRGASR